MTAGTGNADSTRPIVLVTGAAGNVGSAVADALGSDYEVIGLDRAGTTGDVPIIEVDISSEVSLERALEVFRSRYGSRIASVVHLAAYFDFSGEDDPRYTSVNVDGSAALLRALQKFEVEQFVYSGTMLVHAPTEPGERIDECREIAPKWAYPKSKAAAEEAIRREHGSIPIVLLHLAGMYDDETCVPTFAHQISRIYERDFKSHLYSGDVKAGQAMLHKQDLVDAFKRAVDRRRDLPGEAVILIGEPETMGYDELQDEIGRLIHGEDEWRTLQVPAPAAAFGALVQEKLEPVVPDAIDHGEKPFIRPFMVAMADDHYALDIGRAEQLLGWRPKHAIRTSLPDLVASLTRDPAGWYKANKVTPPAWLAEASADVDDADAVRSGHEKMLRKEHARFVWAHAVNLGIGAWLFTGPPMLGLQSTAMVVSDMAAGLLLMIFAACAMSWRMQWARWVCGAIGFWLLFAPLAFWAPAGTGYLNDTLVGMLVIGFALLTSPEPGVSPMAAMTGPSTPPGWNFNPSSWVQRIPIIALAFVGLQVSRYLAGYQLGYVDHVWEPFFAGGPDPKNGTEEIITSSVSQAWPVADGGLGAMTYALEIVTGVIGSQRRWRTMPWLVLLFGVMIVPLGVVSIFFIIIQPIWIGTWSTLALIGAAAMVVQIPYSLDEILATCQFLWRRKKAGQSLLRVLMAGDTDDIEGSAKVDAKKPVGGAAENAKAAAGFAGERPFERPVGELLLDMVSGGVNVPWNMALATLIGIFLMCSRLLLGAEGSMADAHHIVGSLVVTVSVMVCAEIARSLRFLNAVLGLALAFAAFAFAADALQLWVSLGCALALALLTWPRGRVMNRYGNWNRYIV